MEPTPQLPSQATAQPLTKKEIVAILEKEGLQAIPFLKIIHQFEKTIHFKTQVKGKDYGIVIDLPCASSGFYFNLYPLADSVLFLTSSEPELLKPLLQTYLHTPLMIATPNEEIFKVASSLFPLTYQRSYISYVCKELSATVKIDQVQRSKGFTPEVIALFHQNGFHDADLAKFAAWGAQTFTLSSPNHSVASVCFIFPNTETVWEIAGVRTQESERGKGLAKKIVQAAASYILQQGWTPRYQVENSNTASIQLALSLGFEKFLELKHYLTPVLPNPPRSESVN